MHSPFKDCNQPLNNKLPSSPTFVFSGASYHVSEVFVFSEHAGQPITAVERASVLSIGWAGVFIVKYE
jgi:hypothetical protein